MGHKLYIFESEVPGLWVAACARPYIVAQGEDAFDAIAEFVKTVAAERVVAQAEGLSRDLSHIIEAPADAVAEWERKTTTLPPTLSVPRSG